MSRFMYDDKFTIGVNYWASHNSIRMWEDWDADVVDSDFAKLAGCGVTHLRVFPLWPVFQPLRIMWANLTPFEYRMGPDEQPLPDTEAGRAGVSEEACEHFAEFCKLAEKHGLKLIVGLFTGHMSFRFFWPEAFQGKNFLSDPTVIKWELKFARYFVKRFLAESSIVAWDLGNEVNCLSGNIHPDQTFVWTSAIVSAIREVDNIRPVVSGLAACDLHEGAFNLRDHGELVDIMTTHPYQIFSATKIDPIDSMRAEIDPIVRARLYESLAKKPCFIEEVGSIGYTNCSEKSEASFLRAMLFSAWSEGARGVYWWCAFDQGHLDYAPYDWNNIGSDYGFFRNDGSAKPLASVSSEFANFLRSFPYSELPPCKTDAVCIIPRDMTNSLPVLDTTFILAKQANINLSFSHADEPLPDSDLYIMPSVESTKPIFLRRLNELLERVRKGATLYLSMGNTLFRRLPELSGLTVDSREYGEMRTIIFGEERFRFSGMKYNVSEVSDTCEVLAYDESKQPVFVRNDYGNGRIYFSLIPFERQLSERAGIFKPNSLPYYKIYDCFASSFDHHAIKSSNPVVLATDHYVNSDNCIVVATNYANTDQAWGPIIREGWKIAKYHHGEEGTVRANDAVVLELERVL